MTSASPLILVQSILRYLDILPVAPGENSEEHLVKAACRAKGEDGVVQIDMASFEKVVTGQTHSLGEWEEAQPPRIAHRPGQCKQTVKDYDPENVQGDVAGVLVL